MKIRLTVAVLVALCQPTFAAAVAFDDGAGADPPFNAFCHDRSVHPDPGYTG